MVPYTTKRCSTCGEHKPLGEFHRRRARADGRQSNCKLCNLSITKQWTEDNRSAMARYSRRWRLAHPGYHTVHKWMSRKYQRYGRCEECGAEGRTEWANISGRYLFDRSDFEELYRPCHAYRDAERREELVA